MPQFDHLRDSNTPPGVFSEGASSRTQGLGDCVPHHGLESYHAGAVKFAGRYRTAGSGVLEMVDGVGWLDVWRRTCLLCQVPEYVGG
jgi:hypothetical protein